MADQGGYVIPESQVQEPVSVGLVAVEEGAAEDLTERDVLLGLVMEALQGGPVDVVASVTALGFVDLVEEAKALLEIEAADEAEAGGEPADDPDAPELAPSSDDASSDSDSVDSSDAASDGGDAA